MAKKMKIAVSLAPEVLVLLDRHARGRSRSRCVEEELLSALRAREWERLSGQLVLDEADQLAWAEQSFALADEALTRDEQVKPAHGAPARRATQGVRR